MLLHRHIFVVVFGIIFALMNSIYMLFPILVVDFLSLLYLCLLDFFMFGFAYDLTGFLLELILPELHIPSLPFLSNPPEVAVVCCICDDADLRALKALFDCSYPKVHRFILDDSMSQSSRAIVDSLGISTVRRIGREGYKAGNLNHWLSRYGSRFQYFIVLDSDSILPRDFVTHMLAYAEHPSNQDVAVFESVILPWNLANGFTRLQRVVAWVARREPLRIGNRFISNFSAGHNNLFRTSAINSIGGFSEKYIAEDYATWIELVRNRWRSLTVPVESYERVPTNLSEYAKRRARHACQTFQLASISLRGISWTARLRLLRALHLYSLPIVSLISAILLIFVNFNIAVSHAHFDNQSLAEFSTAAIFWSIIIALTFVCPGVRAKTEAVPILDFMRSTVFEGALFAATSWTIASRLVHYWAGRQLQFDVTGVGAQPSFLAVLKMSGPGVLIYLVALISILLNPYLSGLNLVWAIPAVLSPIIIYRFQRVPHDKKYKPETALQA